MATSTNLISNIFIPLLAMVFSFLGGLGGGYFVWKLNNNNERYQKLYGPLKFNLLMMRLMVANREKVLEDIKNLASAGSRIDLMRKHMSPLTQKWIEHRDIIRNLFEENPGLIKKDDFSLMADFMDGCIKREITEEGKNDLADDENRTKKLLKAVEDLQNKLL